ncbi:hypothetical protein V7S43_016081 [Phytophthora oleae]|uniref:Uncharacterized protein n=1 Tax=Phytophthora oleae TaxID=2107226 RepID=A0ABD3EWW6_9STRA
MLRKVAEYATSPEACANSADKRNDVFEDGTGDGALKSDSEGSDAGSAEWYEEMGELPVFDDRYEPDVEDASPQQRAGSTSACAVRKDERERWKDVIDSWRKIEGDDLLEHPNDTAALKRMRTEGWEADPSKFSADEDFPGLYDGQYRPTRAALDCAESPLVLFLFIRPREFWLGVKR